MGLRLLVNERVANIGIALDAFMFLLFRLFLDFEFFLGFWLFANQLTVHYGHCALKQVLTNVGLFHTFFG